MGYLEERFHQKIYGKPPKEKKKYVIPKVSEKKKAEMADLKAKGTDKEMDNYFKAMRKQMTGACLFCGGKSQKKDDDTFHFSLAHLLPKAIFKSVATHPDNVIELCFYGNSCHSNFDGGQITWEFLKDSAEWSFIKEKLLHVLPMVAEGERKHKLFSKLSDLIYETKQN